MGELEESYSMKIPRKLADLFEKFIEKNPNLGYRKVSQYVLYVLQDHARELLANNFEIKPKREKVIDLKSGIYSKEALQRILEDMEE